MSRHTRTHTPGFACPKTGIVVFFFGLGVGLSWNPRRRPRGAGPHTLITSALVFLARRGMACMGFEKRRGFLVCGGGDGVGAGAACLCAATIILAW